MKKQKKRMSVLPRAVIKNETEGEGEEHSKKCPNFYSMFHQNIKEKRPASPQFLKKHLTLHSTPTDVTNENDFPTKLNSTCSQCTILTDVNISLAKKVESLKHENERYSQEINILKPCSIQYNARRVNQHLKTFFIA